ncbi:MAG: hypothetical protein FJW40_19805 [Acidobacteria bacterium]|nr:hypothetical protein [Acidobacteriota bacterium]
MIAVAAILALAADFTGWTRCAGCHPREAAAQAGSPHANALHRPASHPLRSGFTGQSATRDGRFRFTFDGAAFRGGDGVDTIALPVEWAFGSGLQAVTFVSRVNEEFHVEHGLSFYTRLGGLGVTPGQGERRVSTLVEASGLLYKTSDPKAGIAGCFECHSTGGVRLDSANTVAVAEAGVRCEACHGAGSLHAARPSRLNIANPKRLSAAALNVECGRCHRPPAAPGTAIDWNYAWNVRHQPVYLSQSQCFQKSRGRLTCFTCHQPHGSGQAVQARANAECSACHGVAPRGCSSNCSDCHMPLVSPQAGLRFANHWIGVYGVGSKLKPRETKPRARVAGRERGFDPQELIDPTFPF